jgi:phage terminase Nu1 subunit (DNA packaging protein)
MYDLDALQEWREAKQPGANADITLGAARARLAEAQAVKWERENLVRSGQLIERTAAVAEGQAVLAALKARLLSLPRQAVIRGMIQRESEPALRALVVDALRELARWVPPEEAAKAS